MLLCKILHLNLKWVFKFLTFHGVTMLHVRTRNTNSARTLDCFADRRQLLNKIPQTRSKNCGKVCGKYRLYDIMKYSGT